VDRQGLAVADSDRPGAVPRDFSTRPEMAAALDGRRAQGTRHSATLSTDLVYVAVPVASGGVVHGAVRITYPTSALDARVRRSWWGLAWLCATVLEVVAAVGVVLARGVSRPPRW
jgi:DNA-binding IclR family transcriptional regulator